MLTSDKPTAAHKIAIQIKYFILMRLKNNSRISIQRAHQIALNVNAKMKLRMILYHAIYTLKSVIHEKKNLSIIKGGGIFDTLQKSTVKSFSKHACVSHVRISHFCVLFCWHWNRNGFDCMESSTRFRIVVLILLTATRCLLHHIQYHDDSSRGSKRLYSLTFQKAKMAQSFRKVS